MVLVLKEGVSRRANFGSSGHIADVANLLLATYRFVIPRYLVRIFTMGPLQRVDRLIVETRSFDKYFDCGSRVFILVCDITFMVIWRSTECNVI